MVAVPNVCPCSWNLSGCSWIRRLAWDPTTPKASPSWFRSWRLDPREGWCRRRTERENGMIRTPALVPCLSSHGVFRRRGVRGDGRRTEGRGWDSGGGAREQRRSSTGERRGRRREVREKEGGTVAITSPESRLLVSCSCPDFVSLSLSLYSSLFDSRRSVSSQRRLSDILVAHFVPVWLTHKAAM